MMVNHTTGLMLDDYYIFDIKCTKGMRECHFSSVLPLVVYLWYPRIISSDGPDILATLLLNVH